MIKNYIEKKNYLVIKNYLEKKNLFSKKKHFFCFDLNKKLTKIIEKLIKIFIFFFFLSWAYIYNNFHYFSIIYDDLNKVCHDQSVYQLQLSRFFLLY